MRQSTARVQHIPRLQVIIWAVTALVCWGGLFSSLPGYYFRFVEQPLRLQFPAQQLLLTYAGGAASLICAVISMSLGSFLFVRKPDDRTALFVSYYLLMYGFFMGGPLENLEFMLTGQTLNVSYKLQAILFNGPAILLLLIFPDGKVLPRTRWIVPLTIPITLVMALLPVEELNSITTWRSQFIYGFTGLIFLFALGTQVYRYVWKSSPLERQQTKVVIYGFALQFFLLSVSSVTFFQLTPEMQSMLSGDYAPDALLWWMSLSILPISFTLAIIRARLWDIDVVIRRTLVYGFLSVTLAVVYFGSVVLMQAIFRQIAGQESPVAVILSTLVIASLFTPLRGAIQSVIDRRFYRSKYNAEQALDQFQQSLRGMADLEQVESELTGIVHATVQPEWTEIWVRKPL